MKFENDAEVLEWLDTWEGMDWLNKNHQRIQHGHAYRFASVKDDELISIGKAWYWHWQPTGSFATQSPGANSWNSWNPPGRTRLAPEVEKVLYAPIRAMSPERSHP